MRSTDETIATSRPRETAHKPSVDVLFTSLVKRARPGVAALLTGMGKDGAQGMLEMRNSGAYTIAQDEASSVVWGMPGAVIRAGLANDVLPLEAIGDQIVRCVCLGRSRSWLAARDEKRGSSSTFRPSDSVSKVRGSSPGNSIRTNINEEGAK